MEGLSYTNVTLAVTTDKVTRKLLHETDTNNPGLTVVSLLLILVGIIGIAGNSLVLIILLKIIKRHKKNQTYWLIGNQSAADMFSSVQMILIQIESLSQRWQTPPNSLGGRFYCYLWTTQIFMFGSFVVSSFNLTILSLERYFAVVHPLFYITKLRHSFCLVGIMAWLYAPIMQYITVGFHFKYTKGECVYERGSPFLGVLLFMWEYFFPVSIMSFCFIQISRKFKELNHIQNTWLKQDVITTARNVADKSSIKIATSSTYTDNDDITIQNHAIASRADPKQESFQKLFVAAHYFNVGTAPSHVVTTQQHQAHTASSHEVTTKSHQSNTASSHEVTTQPHQAKTASSNAVTTTQLQQVNVRANGERKKGTETTSSIQRRNTTVTLFTVYIAYIICWTCNQFSFLVYNLGGPLNFDGVYYRFALIMATSNSCINVFIYAFRFKMFQQGFKSLFKWS